MRFIPYLTLHLSQNTPFSPLECGGGFSFELSGDSGAALVTRYPTYREDSIKESAFVKYTKRHYESWVTFARQKEYGDDVRPVLVSGFDMTMDFAMAAYSNVSASLESELITGVPMFASASAALWGTWCTRHSPHTNYGPQDCMPPSSERAIGFSSSQLAERSRIQIPSEYNQCVFIRYYTMRMRLGLFPKVIRARAGPHDLGPGDNTGGACPDILAQSDAESALSDDGDPGEEGEDADRWPGVVVRNTPSVWSLPCALFPL